MRLFSQYDLMPDDSSSFLKSFYIYFFFQAIKIEEISCQLNVNPQAQSPDIMSPASPVSEKTDGMQENFGASPALSDDSPTSETIHGGQIIDADPVPLNCISNGEETTSTREKKPILLKKIISYFDPFPTPDLAACGDCKSRPRRKKA